MNIEGKIWGTTSLLFCKNNVEIHRIVGLVGGFSSKHCHTYKHNLFFVEKGHLIIRVWTGDIIDETHIRTGDSFSVAPGVWHQFQVVDDNTIAYEVYWSTLPTDDIIREGVGGIVKG